MYEHPPTLDHLLLPRISLPIDPVRCREIDRRTELLARRVGVIGPQAGAMTLDRYRAGSFGLLAQLAYPGADLEGVTLCNDFNTYLFYVDDQAEEDENYGKRPELLEAYFQGHVHALRRGEAPYGEDPGTRLLLDIRARLLTRASLGWVDRFSDEVEAYLMRGTLVGAKNWTSGRVPELSAYCVQRAWDSAVFCSQDLAELVCAPQSQGPIAAELRGDPDFELGRRLVTRVVAFTNDLVSYTKEVKRHLSPNNLLHVLMVHEGLNLGEAMWRAVAMINDDVQAFERIARALTERHGVGRAGRTRGLDTYQSSQRAWMRGNLVWSLRTGRYRDPESPFAELRRDPRNLRKGAVAPTVSRHDQLRSSS